MQTTVALRNKIDNDSFIKISRFYDDVKRQAPSAGRAIASLADAVAHCDRALADAGPQSFEQLCRLAERYPLARTLVVQASLDQRQLLELCAKLPLLESLTLDGAYTFALDNEIGPTLQKCCPLLAHFEAQCHTGQLDIAGVAALVRGCSLKTLSWCRGIYGAADVRPLLEVCYADSLMEKLWLSGTLLWQLSDRDITAHSDFWGRLKSVRLAVAQAVNAKEHLPTLLNALSDAEELALSGALLRDIKWKKPKDYEKNPKVTRLSLLNCPGLGRSGVAEMTRRYPNLQFFYADFHDGKSNTALQKKLLKNCKGLSTINTI